MPASMKKPAAAAAKAKALNEPAARAKAKSLKKPAAAAAAKAKSLKKPAARAKAKALKKPAAAKQGKAKSIAKKPVPVDVEYISGAESHDSDLMLVPNGLPDPPACRRVLRYQCVVCGNWFPWNDMVTELWGYDQAPFRYCQEDYAGGRWSDDEF